MSPVITESDVAVLLSQKTSSGNTIYLYPVVRDIDVLLSDESGPETLEELLREGLKPTFNTIHEMFHNSDDFTFVFDEDAGTIQGTHKNLISAGSAKGTEGEIAYGGEIRIPSFTFDKNGHITGTGSSVIKLPKGYTLPKASTTALGGMIVGTGLSVDADGKVSVIDNGHAHTIENISGLQAVLNKMVSTDDVSVTDTTVTFGNGITISHNPTTNVVTFS